MSLSGVEKSPRNLEIRTGPSPNIGRPNNKVLSINRQNGSPQDELQSALGPALHSSDSELDQLLSALREIANGLKSGVRDAHKLDSALQRAASCALRQSVIDREIRNLAVTDELTGLYNRRGFLASATHQLKMAHRNGEDVLLLFCDVNNLKAINDTFGHHEGDLALIRAASALKATFRDSDILARLGGDEFAVLASDASTPSRQAIVPRIEKSLEQANAACLRYSLSFSIGVARFDPCTPTSLGELMALADQQMYAHKKSRREPGISKRS